MTTDEPGPIIGLEQRTLRMRVHALLSSELRDGKFQPGERLNEVELSTRYGVSRGTVREALRALEQEELLLFIPHRGTFVRMLSPEEALDLAEVRLALETAAAVRLSMDFTAERRRLLNDALTALSAATKKGTPFAMRMQLDQGFHEAICIAAGNGVLLESWRGLMGRMTLMFLSVGPEKMSRLQDAHAHRSLIDVIERAAPRGEIEEVFRDHFMEGMDTVVAALRERSHI